MMGDDSATVPLRGVSVGGTQDAKHTRTFYEYRNAILVL